MKKNIRIIIDILMVILLPILMAYSLVGETLHEVAGSVLFVLFIIHNLLNRKWYGSLLKGRYSSVRVFRTILNLSLIVIMILQPLSGILMSKHLYTFLPSLPISSLLRRIHMILAYWGYVLMSIHAGSHLGPLFHKLKTRNKVARIIVCVILGSISAYACIAFIGRGFPGYMLGRVAFAFFDYNEPRILFFLDYLSIMLLFMLIGFFIVYWFGRKRQITE